MKEDDRLISPTSGLMCLYQTTGGMVFFTEAAVEASDRYLLDGKKTLVVRRGPAGIEVTRCHEALFGKPDKIEVLKTAMAMVTDLTDKGILAQCRAAVAGLVSPSDNGRGIAKH